MNAFRRFVVAAVMTAAAAGPALADPQDGPIVHTDQLVVVTPNAPVVINNGGAPGAAPQQMDPQQPPPGYAPPYAQPSNGAPQNEPWDNVSHINGTLVKVGEKG